jgi:hypothetical protein
VRTVTIILGGLVVFGLFAFGVWRFGGSTQSVVTAAKVFIAVWLVAALINMWIGVSQAGSSVAEELPIFLAIFAIPAVVAAFVWWKFS